MSTEYKFDYKKVKPNRFAGHPSDSLIAKIREHRAELNRLSVKSIAIFGSVARGEARKDSDVDILVEFDGALTFDRFMDTKFYLEDAKCFSRRCRAYFSKMPSVLEDPSGSEIGAARLLPDSIITQNSVSLYTPWMIFP